VRLIGAEVLEAKEAEFDTRRGQLPRRFDLALLDDPLAGRALKWFLLLTEMPDLVADQGLSAEELFWGRYYWFLRYARLRGAVTGRDAGLEQQAFQLLEHPYPACRPDWSVLEEVEAAAERDAAAQLREAYRGGRVT
jgi:hypothetical protein